MSFPELLLDRMVWFIPLLLSLTVHEWAHAWTAWRLGDDTAKMQARVSLNPLDHIDPVGTLLLPLMGVPFGWARPVPVNPVRFRTRISMPFGMLLTAAAGPLSNVLLAAVSVALLVIFHPSGLFASLPPDVFAAVSQILHILVIVNVLLACFNLLPIPPLDGSRIADAVMPTRFRPQWNRFSALGPLLLAAVILLPVLLGASILAWPLRLIDELLSQVVLR